MLYKLLSRLKRLMRQIFYKGSTKKIYRKLSNFKIYLRRNMSDKTFIRRHFIENTGIIPNINNPQHYHEKVLWLKSYYRNPLMKICSDKYQVREYVEKNGYADLLPTIYGVFEKFSDIDFSVLPDKVFIKSNHTSGHNMMVNKTLTNLSKAKEFFDRSSEVNYSTRSREWNYDGIKPYLIVEPYLDMDNYKDYKFFVFDGNVEFFQILQDINDDKGIQTSDYRANLYDKNLKLLKKTDKFRKELDNSDIKFTKHLDYIWEAAEILGSEFPFCRVDFVVSEEKYYFGEITFFPDGGNMVIDDECLSKELGSKIKLEKIPNKHIKK